jgi:uncharacterized membrane protein
MNAAHIHLLLNHFPTVGFGIGLGLFLIALVGKNEELKRAGLVILFLVAALAIPTYITGNAAAEILKDRTDLSQGLIRTHEDAAMWGLLCMEITGFIAFIGIWQFRLTSRVPRWNSTAVLLLAILSFTVMARAANIGGEIRHPEILANPGVTDEAANAGLARSLGAFVVGHTWVWPSCETLHFVGLSLLFTVVMLVDFRMLGLAKGVPFSALYQLLPLGIVGFGLNLSTGMLFFIGAPQQYTKNAMFYWKMLFVVLGAINVLYFMLLDEPWKVGAGDDAPLTAKLVAASAIFLWIGVLFFGHMLPFLGNSF